MTKTTTNLLGIIITILAGTYFFIMYCSECGITEKEMSKKETVVPENTQGISSLVLHNNENC